MDDLLKLEVRLTEAIGALDGGQRVASERNELAPLASELRRMRDRCRLHRARLVDGLATQYADRPGRQQRVA